MCPLPRGHNRLCLRICCYYFNSINLLRSLMTINFTINLRDDNVEKAIKKMKTKMSKLGLVKGLREKMYYEKPSDKKVRVRKANIINSKKKKRMRERNI